jgi:hypothetical protein
MILALFRHLFELGLLATGLFLFVSLMIATEIGYRLGRQAVTRNSAKATELSGISTLTAGMAGLLAFTLGLSISFGQSRFEARRNLVLTEANAIGTAWLRAKLIDGDEGAVISKKIEDFARTRLAFTTASLDLDTAPLIARANALQAEIWQPLQVVARRAPNTITTALVNALNEMFDDATAQQFAYQSRVPPSIMLGLFCGGILSIGALGYQFGLQGGRQTVLSTLLLTMWSGGMLLIVDLQHPRIGTIRVDASPLIWVINGFGPR